MNKSNKQLWTKDFIIIVIINFFLFLGYNLAIPVLPIYVHKLGGSDSISGLVIGAVPFAAMIVRPTIGYLLDTFGRKIVIIISFICFSLIVFSQGFVDSILMLVILRAIQGLFWGCSTASTSTVASDIIPYNRIAEGMGFFGVASSLASALGPPIGIFLIMQYSFMHLYNVSALLVIMAILLLFNISFISLPSKSVRKNGIFEKRALRPAVLMFFVAMFYGAISSYIGTFIIHLNIPNSSLYFPIYALTLLITRPLIGSLVDKKGYDYAIIPGMFSLCIATLIFSSTQTLFPLLIGGVFFGLGFGTLLPSLQAMTVAGIEANRRGTANSTFFVGYDSGIGVGALVFGSLLENFGYSLSFRFMIIPALMIFIVNLLIKKQHKISLEN